MKFKIGSFFKTSFINIHRSNKISDSRGTGTNNRRYIVLFITSSKYVCKKRNDVIKLKNIECYPPPLPRICIYFFFIINFVLVFFSRTEIYLTDEEKDKLHEFELQCLEDYVRHKENKLQTSANKRISAISERWVSP